MPRSLALLALLVACQSSRDIAVQVTIPGLDSLESPVAGIEVRALPYDRDSALAALAAQARTPRPDTRPLDSAFADFRTPFARYSTLAYRVDQLKDSIATLRAARDAATDGVARETLNARRQAASDSLAALEPRRAQARQVLDAARDRFVQRTDSLRQALHRWEDSTYHGWDSIVRGLAMRRRQDPLADTTDATGWARFKLPPGRWWIYARSWDLSDPNAEWYWNLSAESDTVVLSSHTGQRRPRY